MRLELTGRHVEITPALRRLVEGKLSKLERVLNDRAVSAHAVLTREKHRHRTDVTLHARGEKFLHGVGDTGSWTTSISQAMDKISQQFKRVKGKWEPRGRRRAGDEVSIDSPPGRALDGRSVRESVRMPRILRAMNQPIKPMTAGRRRTRSRRRRRRRRRLSRPGDRKRQRPVPPPQWRVDAGADRSLIRPTMAHSPSVSVGALLGSRPEVFGLPLELMAGFEGLSRIITSPHIQKTGLALAGFHEYLKPGRVLIFGESEIRYLESLAPTERIRSLRLALTLDFPCILITGGFTPPAEVVVEAERARLPVLKTPVPTPTAIAKLTSMLEDSLADRTIIHAVLLDVLGLGVLLVGESGIGKSECALDLIVRGHRLVADDTVEIRRRQETILIGTCPELTRHHMELRGLGVINIKELFGIASTRSSKRVELVVQLERWDPDA